MHADVFDLTGSTIDGKYRVDAVIGGGGFGVVYRGWHLSFDHPIAIKCLRVPADRDARVQARFLELFRNEGRLLSTLSRQHLSFVGVYDAGVVGSAQGLAVPYLVLEWLEGSDLAGILAARRHGGDGVFSEREAIDLLRPALSALSHAHRAPAPVAHRDIKPGNLFVQRDGAIKVLDLGIAKVMEASATPHDHATTQLTPLTAQYAAPEQLQPGRDGYGATGPWTDVHALGLVLVEMLTGVPALEATNDFVLFTAVTSSKRPTPWARAGRHAASEAMEAICAKALALQPADRYRDAGELLDALDALCDAYEDDGATQRTSSRASQAPRAARTSVPRITGSARPAPSRALRPLGLAALVALGAAVSGYVFMQQPARLIRSNGQKTQPIPELPSPLGARYDAAGTTGVVLDRQTRLSWQRALPTTYAGCTGGGLGDAVGSGCSWSDAQQYCDALLLGEHDDWRLPSVDELKAIMSESPPHIDPAAFENSDGATWTATRVDGHPKLAFRVDPSVGAALDTPVEAAYGARCVR